MLTGLSNPFLSREKKAALAACSTKVVVAHSTSTAPVDIIVVNKPFRFNPFKHNAHRAKLYPTPAVRAPCCEKRLDTMPSPEQDEAPIVVYKVVNWAALRNTQTTTVGYKRVPFTPLQNAYHRTLRQDGLVLDRIDEEDTGACESCHAHTLSSLPSCVSVTVR
ncbi:Aste57867_130 [Aphanomyces stellatus]|uniref:Aste57867_130 protein n=1 Tax=Aphanomyces stellatus TaxID=120398 RepID=A0A485K5Y8_9STRA|nr:hypothetical protein As57867_000130 [Aphanomyces stellatus]VFT77356.1 Aste57867_130 [Aphanomyces stellatus]